MIAITGLGAVCGFGRGVAALRDGVWSGRTAIGGAGPWEGAGPVASLSAGPHLTSELALDAVREALGHLDPSEMGLCGASTSGDMVRGEREYRRCLEGEAPGEGFLWAQLCDRPTQRVGDALGFGGPRQTCSTACTSGAVAVETAAAWIRAGWVSAAVAFGADALCRMTLHGFGSLGSVSATPCRPFDRERSGLSLGEGAGAVLLESADRAAARGARILGWLVGTGSALDAHHLTAPDPAGRGARRAIAGALVGLRPEDVGYVCAHGTATPLNDVVEATALAEVLPGAAVSSVKGALGHTLGAAGALELVVTTLALSEGRLPPNTGLDEPEIPLDYVYGVREVRPRYALSVNFAFGGHNTALCVQRCD